MNKMLKPLAVAAVSIAMLAPAKADSSPSLTMAGDVLAYVRKCADGPDHRRASDVEELQQFFRERRAMEPQAQPQQLISGGVPGFTGDYPENVWTPDIPWVEQLHGEPSTTIERRDLMQEQNTQTKELVDKMKETILAYALAGADVIFKDHKTEAGKAIEEAHKRASTDPNFCSTGWLTIVAVAEMTKRALKQTEPQQ
jgi:hypothetical protein